MSKQEELDRYWRKIQELDKEIRVEIAECKKRRTKTQRYLTLSRDMSKLKAEYEKAKGKGVFNSLSVEHNERVGNNSLLGPLRGKTGSDTHHGPGEKF